MSWRISIDHVSTYRYASIATTSYNEVRMTPTSSGSQMLLDSRITAHPGAALYRYRDYFGTTVHAFDLHEPHTELVVVSASTVDTAPSAAPLDGLRFADLHDDKVEDRMSEYLLATEYTRLDEELESLAREHAGSLEPAGAVEAISAFVRSELAYVPGSTAVTTAAIESWHQRSGVCQDFAHLCVGLLRSLGVPARYVSGYLHPRAEAEVGEVVEGASHAWVEAWLGEWCALDPTNGRKVDEQHVVVGRGRDYADVAPLRGIYHGGRLAELSVEVQITRLA